VTFLKKVGDRLREKRVHGFGFNGSAVEKAIGAIGTSIIFGGYEDALTFSTFAGQLGGRF
jgi:hypothetical protein